MEGVEWIFENNILKAKEVEQMQQDLKTARLNKLEETEIKSMEKVC